MITLIIILFILICLYCKKSSFESYQTLSTTTIDNPFSGGNYNVSQTTYTTTTSFINPNEDKNILKTSIEVDGVPLLETEKKSL